MTYNEILNKDNKNQELKQKEIETIDLEIAKLQESKQAIQKKYEDLTEGLFNENKIAKEKEVEEFENKIKKDAEKENNGNAKVAKPNESDLLKMKEYDLIAMANSMGLKVTTKQTKPQIISMILSA